MDGLNIGQLMSFLGKGVSYLGKGGGFAKFMGGPYGMALSLIAPTLLSSVLGERGMSAKELRRRAEEMMSPDAIDTEANKQFSAFSQGPAYAMMKAQLAQGGQSAASAIQRQLGRAGLGRSGVGTAMMGAAAAAPDIEATKIAAQAWDTARQQATQLQQQRVNNLLQLGPNHSMARDIFGATVAGAMPALLNWKFNNTNTTTTTDTKNDAGNKFMPIKDMQKLIQPSWMNQFNSYINPKEPDYSFNYIPPDAPAFNVLGTSTWAPSPFGVK